MKKLLAILLLSLFSVASAQAASFLCNVGTLNGYFSMGLIGVMPGSPVSSNHVVARLSFDGTGHVSLVNGYISQDGVQAVLTGGTGTYSIGGLCIARGTLTVTSTNNPKPTVVTFEIYLDKLDNTTFPAVSAARHGSMIISTNNGDSMSGEINALIGKY